MPKRIFSIIFAIFLLISTFSAGLTASAFEVTEFDITANAGMLASLDTGEIIYENNIDEKVYPASITKIMTAILMLESEKYDPTAKVAMTEEILDLVLGTGLAVSLMQEGEEFTQLDLLYLVLMSSYGDSTYLAAQIYGNTIEHFVDMMNQKAAELGLTGTNYTNPVGLHDDNNYTTVRDIHKLTVYALKNETFSKICGETRYTFSTSRNPKRVLSTTNFLQDPNTNYYYQYAKGVKTGFTDEAGRCLVSTASFKGYNYMCILMGCPNQPGKRAEFLESAELYRWAFRNFSLKEVANSNDPVCEMPVNLSFDTDFVPLHFKEPFVTVLPNEADESTIVITPHLNAESTNAPIKKGQVLGWAEVKYAEKVIGKVDLIAGNDVKESGILVFTDGVKKVFNSVYMKVLYWAIVIVVIVFIILCIKLNMNRLKKRKVKYIPYKEEKRHEK